MLFRTDMMSVNVHVLYSISECIVRVYLEMTVTIDCSVKLSEYR